MFDLFVTHCYFDLHKRVLIRIKEKYELLSSQDNDYFFAN